MSILRQSLYNLYAGNPEILDMLSQLDFSQLDKRFKEELYSRISKEDVELAQMVLASDLLKHYDTAVFTASMACTRQISELLDLMFLQKEEGKLQ